MKEKETKAVSAKGTENEKNNESKGKKIVMTIFNTFINVLIVLVLVVSLVVATLALTSKANNGVPSILGYSFHTIQTKSMEGGNPQYEGGSYDVGDLVIGKTTGGNPNEVYEVGDIVVYTTGDDDIAMVVHRIIEVEDVGGGVLAYTTKGDNNDIPDSLAHTADQIVAVTYDHNFHGSVIKGVGKVLDFIRTGQGFFFVVLLPMIIFFLYEIVRVVLNAVNYRNAKTMEEIENSKEDQQAAIDAAVAAALAAMNKSGDSEKKEERPAEAKEEKKEEPKADEKSEAKEEVKTDAAPADLSPEQLEQFKQFMAFQKAQQEQNDNKTE